MSESVREQEGRSLQYEYCRFPRMKTSMCLLSNVLT